jgi:hypothetical protein
MECAFDQLKKRFNILVIVVQSYSQCTLGLIIYTCIILNTTWSSMTSETTTTIRTITLSLPSLLHLSTTRHRLISQASFKGRHSWLQDWCFWTFNPTWSSMCGINFTRLIYLLFIYYVFFLLLIYYVISICKFYVSFKICNRIKLVSYT